MNPLKIALTHMIGKKDLTLGCLISIKYEYLYRVIEKVDDKIYCLHPLTIDRNKAIQEVMINSIDGNRNEIIGHPATLSDFHRWMKENGLWFTQMRADITITSEKHNRAEFVRYDSSKDLLDQDEETLKQIVSLVKETQLISSNQ